jgi:hypothetical protein
VLTPEKRLRFVIQPFYRKELATGNTTSGNYKLLNMEQVMITKMCD